MRSHGWKTNSVKKMRRCYKSREQWKHPGEVSEGILPELTCKFEAPWHMMINSHIMPQMEYLSEESGMSYGIWRQELKDGKYGGLCWGMLLRCALVTECGEFPPNRSLDPIRATVFCWTRMRHVEARSRKKDYATIIVYNTVSCTRLYLGDRSLELSRPAGPVRISYYYAGRAEFGCGEFGYGVPSVDGCGEFPPNQFLKHGAITC